LAPLRKRFAFAAGNDGTRQCRVSNHAATKADTR